MAFQRQVITSLNEKGMDRLGTENLAVRYHDESIVSGSLLTVDPTNFCVVRARGAVLNTYDTGQYPLVTPDKPLVGSLIQGFAWGGSSPWVYEIIYVNRSKLLVTVQGIATTLEMAEVLYTVDFYIHVDTKEGALALTTHLPFNGFYINTAEIAKYAGPAIEQSINQVVQVTPLENINEKINSVVELVKGHLTDFLAVYGIHLNDLKVLILPKDEGIRELLALRALGVPNEELGGMYLALVMARRGLITAPNAVKGLPFNIGNGALINPAALLGSAQ